MENPINAFETSLCVDGRAAQDFGGRGLLAQEVIEGLAQQIFAEDGPAIVAHPKQVLAAPFRRTDTKRTSGSQWLNPLWEKKFIKASQVTWFHRFLPLDRVHTMDCSLITTLLPALKKKPFFLSRKNGHHFVVPSTADSRLLQKEYGVPASQITVVLPAPRRAVMSARTQTPGEGGILVVRDGKRDGMEKYIGVIRSCFPTSRLKQVDLRDPRAVAPESWVGSLQNASVCFYLVQRPMDWATLALEAMDWNIPTLFLDGHSALCDLLGKSLRLNRFLADPPSRSALEKETLTGREALETAGVLEPDYLSRAYRQLYLKLGAMASN